MKNLVAVASLALSFASAISLKPRSPSPRVVGVGIERRNVPDILAHDRARMAKRQSTVSQTLDNEQTLYYANLTLGTPAQSLRLHIDTGSSDLWVNTGDSNLCQSRQNYCAGGVYTPEDSSSYTLVSEDFNISYVDGSGAIGDYVTDTLGFGGVTIEDFQFGIGESSTSAQGVLGIGYVTNEVQVNRANKDPYPNLPQALKDGGHINTNAYSLWLNDLDASTGMILFGGVNSAKYEGDLATLPIIPQYGDYYELTIALTGMDYVGREVSSDSFPAGALLDSGSTLMYLPDDIVETIYNEVSAVYDSSAGAAYAYCDDANQDSSISFTFSGQTITVPFDELFLDAGTTSSGQPLTFSNGRAACLFGIAPAGGATPVLGDTFLRSAYVVYDLENNEISLAQTRFNASDNSVQEIVSGTSGVPGATPVASPVTSIVGQATGGARLGGGATGSATGVGGSSPTGDANAASQQKISFALAGVAAAGFAAMYA